jgi:hypothetical protein
MKIFYDEDYKCFDVPTGGNSADYYTCYQGSLGWDLIEKSDEIIIGARQVPDTVLILVGAPELESEACQ